MHKKSRRGTGCGFIIFLIIVIGAAAYFIAGGGGQSLLQTAYPMKYRDIVEKYAEQNDLDPYLVYAVIKVESGFNPKAVSSAGARGLMQLMEETASDCAKKKNITLKYPEDLYEPDKNIMLGTCYLKGLLSNYGSLDLALAAYNGGTGNVQKWLKNTEFSDGKGGLNQIPFEETEKYVKKVKRAYDRYKEIYSGN